MHLTKFMYSEGQRENMRCRFQKIEAWDGSLQRLWQKSVSTRKAPKSQVSSSFCPTETSSQGGNWDLETLRTSCPTFFGRAHCYAAISFQQLSACLYNHEKNRNTTESLTTACIIPLSILPRLTKISILMMVIILPDHDHHICLLSYSSLIDARYHHDN